MALNKAKKLLLSKRVLENLENLSLDHQTFEEFQRVIHRFVPKNIAFKDGAQMCRLYLAGMHHNENAKRELESSNRKAIFKVAYSKYKKGPASAKPAKTKSTFGYVTELMRLVSTEVFLEPSKFVEQLRMVVPVSV